MADVNIAAPTAVAKVFAPVSAPLPVSLTPEQKNELLQMENTELRGTLQQYQTACDTITNVACCLVRLFAEADVAIIPMELSERMFGASIVLKEIGEGKNRSIQATLTEKTPDPIQIDR
jgi:hypothetical protein